MWTLASLFILEAVSITVANAATIVIFTRTRRLHSKQYIMIISQAVADLLVGLVSVPMFIVLKFSENSSLFEQSFLVQDSLFGSASLFGLAALAIERAHATYFPFRHSTLGNGPYVIGIVLMWTAPLIVIGPYIVFKVGMITSCIIIVLIGFTLVVILTAYFLIVLKVRCSTTTQAHDANVQENKKLTVTLAVVTILSLVMWLPYQLLVVAYSISTHRNKSLMIRVARFFKYGNSLINSVVYAFRMREIKREILRVMQCCPRSNRISINNEGQQGNI